MAVVEVGTLVRLVASNNVALAGDWALFGCLIFVYWVLRALGHVVQSRMNPVTRIYLRYRAINIPTTVEYL